MKKIIILLTPLFFACISKKQNTSTQIHHASADTPFQTPIITTDPITGTYTVHVDTSTLKDTIFIDTTDYRKK